MTLFGKLTAKLRRAAERLAPARKVRTVQSDILPDRLPRRDLILLVDEDEEWSIALRCPCGCGETLEVALLEVVKPNWRLEINSRGQPSLHPSIWRTTGCQSHFWIRDGRVVWCD
ncbi:DUF6527 family protein [Ralstonia mojiangensis]|uniref:DUF6527 family protein n=1 Tax=Ralstonia mojiangensis TaxID=2953895 RepID=UPI003709A260